MVKTIFTQALLMTLLIFGIGLVLGLFLEGYRSDRAQVDLFTSEINYLDEQMRINSIGKFNVSCDFAKNNTFDFADSVYQDALVLEKYDNSHKFKDTFFALHKRYDLLRLSLLYETDNLKNKCGNSFYNLVYLYEYNTEDVDKKALQNYFEKSLSELKAKYPSQVLLLPIATDMGLSSVDSLVIQYNLSSLPAIVLDNNKIFDSFEGLNELKEMFQNTSNSSQ